MVTGTGGSPSALRKSVDVVGHEPTHGVISHTCNLVYSNESGALNGAFRRCIWLARQAVAQATNGEEGPTG